MSPVMFFMLHEFLMYAKQCKIFMSRFGTRYLHYYTFRKFVDGWVFLFLEGKYEYKSKAIENSRKKKF